MTQEQAEQGAKKQQIVFELTEEVWKVRLSLLQAHSDAFVNHRSVLITFSYSPLSSFTTFENQSFPRVRLLLLQVSFSLRFAATAGIMTCSST
jgi:hypothetical protein